MQAVAEVEMPQYVDLTRWKPGTLQKLLVLEGVQDPGNLVRTLLLFPKRLITLPGTLPSLAPPWSLILGP